MGEFLLSQFLNFFMKLIAFFFAVALTCGDAIAQQRDSSYIPFDDTRNGSWGNEFQIVSIPASSDGKIQRAYLYKTHAVKPAPLIISLHTWSGNYRQKDDLASLCMKRDVNYIHPDFRGANKNPAACCSELALADIDDAINYAIKHANVDTNRIFVMGVSGGGYATLSIFMRSKHNIRGYSAWASITDLEAWFSESTIMKDKYAADILACTGSVDTLNISKAKKRSPLFMKTPVKKLKTARLNIYVGVYDGIRGSVPIPQSMNFYNKLLHDIGIKDSTKYISEHEQLQLLEYRRPLGDFGSIGDRRICLLKQQGNLSITIFEGEHEMLSQYALEEILKN